MKSNNHHLVPIDGNGKNEPSSQYGISGYKNIDDDDHNQLDFTELWQTVKRGKWIILGTCVIVVLAVAGITKLMPPIYESSSIVSVSSDMPNNVGVYSLAASRGLQAEIGTLRNSMQIAERVVEGLREFSDEEGKQYTPVLYDDEGIERSESVIIDDILGMTQFGGRAEESMIRISVNSESPEEAAAIANLFAEAYQEYDVESSRESIRAARSFLENQLERREEELSELEAEWASFASARNMPTQGQDGQRMVERFVELEGRRDELEFQVQQHEAAIEQLEQQIAELEPNLRDDLVDETQGQALQNEINTLQQRIAAINADALEYYIANPGLEGDQERIEQEFPALAERLRQKRGFEERRDELMDQLVSQRTENHGIGAGDPLNRVSEMRQQIRQHETNISGLRAQIAGLNNVISEFSGRLDGIPSEIIQREQIERKVAQAERFHAMFMEDLQRTIVAEESELGTVRIVRQAMVPGVPVSPNMNQNLILGLLLGLGFGLGLAFLRQAADSRLQKPEDIGQEGYSLLGVIPKMDREIKSSFKGKDTIDVDGRQVSTRLLPLLNPWSPITENYRLVRTNLKHGNNGTPPQVLLMTSPEQSDGKTVTCVNMAITIAQSGLRTLLVDADLRRPAAHSLLDLPLEAGLADVLSYKKDWMQVVQQTEVDELQFISAGRSEQPPAELLGSSHMHDVIRQLRDAYDVIIIDSPPVLAVSDPVLLSTQCDATMVVVSADRTDQKALTVTRRTLEAVGVQIAGVIFNRFDSEGNGPYGYGYGYGPIYGEEYADA